MTAGGAVSSAVSATRAPSEWATIWTGTSGRAPVDRRDHPPQATARVMGAPGDAGQGPGRGPAETDAEARPGRSRCRWRGQLTAFQQSRRG
jgi:hypothetical protein